MLIQVRGEHMKRISGFAIAIAAALELGLAVLAAAQAPVKPAGAKASFAGGCFWCMESEFEKVPGVASVISGYTGGTTKNPTYEEVSSGATGHFEAVEITFDPRKVTYERLVEIYWENIDPLTANGQFCDRGEQYRSAIFYRDEAQRRVAEESKKKVAERLKGKVVTLILPASAFYPAEEYHQDYYKKNPFRYGLYRKGCGRDELLEQIWGIAPASGNKEKP
jgi:peptide-methionine (S)-S-oxide reductase